MKRLYNNEVNVRLFSENGEIPLGHGRLKLNEEGCDLSVLGNFDYEQLNTMVGVLENNHIIILIGGEQIGYLSSTIKNETKIRFSEALYSSESTFDDLTQKISIELPQLSRWFFRNYYNIRSQGGTKTKIEIENEYCLEFPTGFGVVALYYESYFSFGDAIKIYPKSYIVISFEKKVEKSIAFEKMLKTISFFQSFFSSTLSGNSLKIHNGINWLETHTKLFPIQRKFSEEGLKSSFFLPFKKNKNGLTEAIKRFFENENLHYFLNQMNEDSINNTHPQIRYLSAFRGFEKLSKYWESESDKKTKAKANELWEKIKTDYKLKKFQGAWIFIVFLVFDSIIEMPKNEVILQLANTRNAISHGDYKILAEITNYEMQRFANILNGYNRAILFKMLGFDDSYCKHVKDYFSRMQYFDSYFPSKHSIKLAGSIFNTK